MSDDCGLCCGECRLVHRHDTFIPVDLFRMRVKVCKCAADPLCRTCKADLAMLSCYAVAIAVAAHFQDTDAPLGKMARTAIDWVEGR